MKRAVLLLATIAMVVTMVPQANAIGLFASWQDAKDLNSGIGVGATLPIELGLFRIDPRASWYRYKDDGVNMSPLDIAGELDFGIVYGGLGVSYYIIDSDIGNRWGYYALAGAKISLAGFTLFGDLIWRGSETIDSISFEGGGLNVGIIFF